MLLRRSAGDEVTALEARCGKGCVDSLRKIVCFQSSSSEDKLQIRDCEVGKSSGLQKTMVLTDVDEPTDGDLRQ